MISTDTSRSPFHRRKGGMMVLQAFVMILFLAGAAFSVDIAYMHMVKAELRTAVDAASRAGTETLIRTQDASSAISSAQLVSEQNSVAGDGLTLSNSDIQLGAATQQGNGRFQFTPGGGQLNSVSVVGRRTGQAPDGRVALFFGNVFGSAAFEPVLDSISASSVRDIALILDRSGSMLEPLGGSDGTQTRFEALSGAVSAFLSEIQATSPNARISLTTYSTTANRDIPLTSNFGSIQLAVSAITPDGSTNIFQGLAFGSDSLEQDPNRRSFADKTVILMTDGNFNDGGTPIPSAILASTRNHVVHTITFSDSADQTTMQSVAEVGKGIHIHADDSGDLRNAFREIANTLSVSLIQ